MKINPLDRIQALRLAPSVEKSVPGQGDFKRILDQTVEQKGVVPAESSPLSAVLSPQIVPGIVFNTPVLQGLERILSALERYQHLLADTRASLRAVEPALRQIKQEVDQLEPLLLEIPDEDPLKPVLSETLMAAVKEIARFESGEYVTS